MLQLLSRRANKHVAHEQSMVGTGTDDSNSDSVLLIPACVTVDDINSGSGIQVVDSTFAVDFPYLCHLHVSYREFVLDLDRDEDKFGT